MHISKNSGKATGEPKQLTLPGILEEGPASAQKSDKKVEFFAKAATIGLFGGMAAAVIFTGFMICSDVMHPKKPKVPETLACQFQNSELKCSAESKELNDIKFYIARLPYQINMKNRHLVKLFEQTKIVISTGYKETNGNLGTYSDIDVKMAISADSVTYGSGKNVGVHEFLHMAYDRYLDNAAKNEIAGIIEPLMGLAMQMDEGSIPWLEKDLGKLNPVEVAFLLRVRKLLEIPSIACIPVNELFAYMADEAEMGIVAPLVPFYSQILSRQYISTHGADPGIRFEEMIHFYCKDRNQQKKSGFEFPLELPVSNQE